MTVTLGAGPPATPADRRAAAHVQEAVYNELPRVRAAALAWRNGVAGLLAGLIGFSLVKGRSDIGELAEPFDVIVGVLLLAALLTGTIAALLLLRAAHGRPAATSLGDAQHAAPLGMDHAETLAAARSLTAGLILGLLCTVLLTTAVGTTWYGPAKDEPRITVTTPGGTRCGEVVRLRSGTLTLKTDNGETDVDLASADGIGSVDSCTATSQG
ncbi:MAG: hypothetical protein ACRDTA_22320 [Pseudonocardiaceae bacterium]